MVKIRKIKEKYRDKKVKIIDIDDKEFSGVVEVIESDLERDDLATYIGIKNKESIISFYEEEIKSIEIME